MTFIRNHLSVIIALMVIISLVLAFACKDLAAVVYKSALKQNVFDGTVNTSLPKNNGNVIGWVAAGTILAMFLVSVALTALEWKKNYGSNHADSRFIKAITIVNIVMTIIGVCVMAFLCLSLGHPGYKVQKPALQFAPVGFLLIAALVHIVFCFVLYKPLCRIKKV